MLEEKRQVVSFSLDGSWFIVSEANVGLGMVGLIETGSSFGLSLPLNCSHEEITAKVNQVIEALGSKGFSTPDRPPARLPKKRKPKPYYRTGRY